MINKNFMQKNQGNPKIPLITVQTMLDTSTFPTPLGIIHICKNIHLYWEEFYVTQHLLNL